MPKGMHGSWNTGKSVVSTDRIQAGPQAGPQAGLDLTENCLGVFGVWWNHWMHFPISKLELALGFCLCQSRIYKHSRYYSHANISFLFCLFLVLFLEKVFLCVALTILELNSVDQAVLLCWD